MFRRIKALSLLLLLCLAPVALAGGKKDTSAVISFHIETDVNENPKMIFPVQFGNQTKYFRRVSEVSTRDVASFSPFPDETGTSFGMALLLKPGAVNRISAITATNLDKWLVARFNGRIVDAVRIDKQITDGVLVIWKGVAIEEINELDKTVPRIGAENTKKKK